MKTKQHKSLAKIISKTFFLLTENLRKAQNNEEQSYINRFQTAARNMKTKLHFIMLLLSMAILGLAACTPAATPIPLEEPVQATAPVIDSQNLTYQIESQHVTLVNGLSELEAAPGSASKTVTKHFGNEAFGDLNGDGKQDVAFILTQSGGGSGTFFYVAAALAPDQGTNAVLLGDRISPQATNIEDATIVVTYLDRKPGEAFAVPPSVPVTKYFKVEDGSLVEVNKS